MHDRVAGNRMYRTVCASGRQHARFDVVPGQETKRVETVPAYDDRMFPKCAPHKTEVSDDDGTTWKAFF